MNKLSITSVLTILTLVIGACSQKVQSEQKGLPALKVSENLRLLRFVIGVQLEMI
jgi:PBP1b-binding outer membrane lipoprotein LpoB